MKEKPFVSLDLHDFSPVNHNLRLLQELKEHYPGFKVTLFMAPFDSQFGKMESILHHQEFAKILADNRDWIEIGVHGFTHKPQEMLQYSQPVVESLLMATENLYKKLKEEKGIDINFVKGFCAPYWLRNTETDKALKKRGYWIAINDNSNPLGLPFYKYNWSIDMPYPRDKGVIRGHGHVQDTCGNGLAESFPSILEIPTDAQWVFCSEALQ